MTKQQIDSVKLDVQNSADSFADRLAAINGAMRDMGLTFEQAMKAAKLVGQSMSTFGVSFAGLADRSMREERERIELEALAKILDDGGDDNDEEAAEEEHKPTRSIRLPD